MFIPVQSVQVPADLEHRRVSLSKKKQAWILSAEDRCLRSMCTQTLQMLPYCCHSIISASISLGEDKHVCWEPLYDCKAFYPLNGNQAFPSWIEPFILANSNALSPSSLLGLAKAQRSLASKKHKALITGCEDLWVNQRPQARPSQMHLTLLEQAPWVLKVARHSI